MLKTESSCIICNFLKKESGDNKRSAKGRNGDILETVTNSMKLNIIHNHLPLLEKIKDLN
jgi:hypothetical protein